MSDTPAIGRSWRITVYIISARKGSRGASNRVERRYFKTETEAMKVFKDFPRPSRKGTYKVILEEINSPKIIDSKTFTGINLPY